VEARRHDGSHGAAAVQASPRLGEVLEAVESGVFSPDEAGRYREMMASIRGHDYFMVSADFDSYFEAQRRVDARWQDSGAWMRSAVLNTARMGWFSSDRTIAEYAREIWDVPIKR